MPKHAHSDIFWYGPTMLLAVSGKTMNIFKISCISYVTNCAGYDITATQF